MAAGVRAGRNRPHHGATSNPGRPDSAIVGSSGAALTRSAVVTASPRAWPARSRSNGATANITLDQGQNPAGGSSNAAPARQLNDGGTHNLAYSLFQDSGRTTIWGNTSGTGVGHNGDGASHAVTIYGKVAKGQNVPSGAYSDVVVATISF